MALANVSFQIQFHKQCNDFQIFYHYFGSTIEYAYPVYFSKMPYLKLIILVSFKFEI